MRRALRHGARSPKAPVRSCLRHLVRHECALNRGCGITAGPSYALLVANSQPTEPTDVVCRSSCGTIGVYLSEYYKVKMAFQLLFPVMWVLEREQILLA